MADKDKKLNPDSEVDMAKIEAMMGGPPPDDLPGELQDKLDDRKSSPLKKSMKKLKGGKKKHTKDVDEAADEANKVLMSMAPGLGKAKIEKVEDEERPPADGREPGDLVKPT
jgi:hypothetical protein